MKLFKFHQWYPDTRIETRYLRWVINWQKLLQTNLWCDVLCRAPHLGQVAVEEGLASKTVRYKIVDRETRALGHLLEVCQLLDETPGLDNNQSTIKHLTCYRWLIIIMRSSGMDESSRIGWDLAEWVRSSRVEWDLAELDGSSRTVSASDSQCRSRNSPGFDPSILRHSGIWGAADETVLKIVLKIPPEKKIIIIIQDLLAEATINRFISHTQLTLYFLRIQTGLRNGF